MFEKFVFLAQLKMWLLKQPEVGAALMSGSGSTVFAVLRSNARCRSSGETRKSRARSGTVDLRVRNAVANSGERTRLACWCRRRAIANFSLRSSMRPAERAKKTRCSRAGRRSPARETRALPRLCEREVIRQSLGRIVPVRIRD